MLSERVSIHDFNSVPAPEPGNAKWTRLSEVDPKPVRFVERPLWQEAAFELLVGEKGCGKGTYLAGLAARMSRGELGERCKVIWIAAGEDSLAMDVWPRIKAAGGVLENIIVPHAIELTLPQSVEDIRILALMQEVGLIVIDPVIGLMRGNYSSNSDADVRYVLRPLNALADELSCLIVGVRHLGKDRSRGALASVLGSVDWVNIPRAVVAVAVDDEDEDKRHVQAIAGNRVRRSESSQAFRIEGVVLPEIAEGEPVTLAVDAGDGKDVQELLINGKTPGDRSSSSSAEAKEQMLDVLDAEGVIESDTLDARIAQATGLSIGTIRNLRTELKREAGLINMRPETDFETGQKRWMVYRTLAPRSTSTTEVHADMKLVNLERPPLDEGQNLGELDNFMEEGSWT